MWIYACLLSASAETVTFQAGDGAFGATADATLVASRAASDQTFASDPLLYADLSDGDQDGAEVRPVLRFPDVVGPEPGQVPVGATIHQATLTLTVDNPGGTLALHEVLEPWVVDEVSWDHRSAELGAWSGPGAGGDSRAPKALDEEASSGATVVFSVTAAVRQWSRDPATNHGVVVVPGSSDGADLHSSESPTPDARPLLTVEFSPPTPDDDAPTDSGAADTAEPHDSGDAAEAPAGGGASAGGGTGKDAGCAVGAVGAGGSWVVGLVVAARRRRR